MPQLSHGRCLAKIKSRRPLLVVAFVVERYGLMHLRSHLVTSLVKSLLVACNKAGQSVQKWGIVVTTRLVSSGIWPMQPACGRSVAPTDCIPNPAEV